MQSSPHRQRVVLRQKSDIKPQRVRQTGIRRRSASFRKVQRHKRQAEAREEKVCNPVNPLTLKCTYIQSVYVHVL